MRMESSEKMTKDSIWNMKTKSSNLKVKKISLRCQKFQISDKFRQTDYKITLSIYFTRRWLIETNFSAYQDVDFPLNFVKKIGKIIVNFCNSPYIRPFTIESLDEANIVFKWLLCCLFIFIILVVMKSLTLLLRAGILQNSKRLRTFSRPQES